MAGNFGNEYTFADILIKSDMYGYLEDTIPPNFKDIAEKNSNFHSIFDIFFGVAQKDKNKNIFKRGNLLFSIIRYILT